MFLIFPKYVDIQRLNTDAQTVMGNTLSSLRDLHVTNANDGVEPRNDGRVYDDPITLQAQIETGQNKALNTSALGNLPDSNMKLVFLMSDLVCVGLVDASGNVLLKPRDRLSAIRDEFGTIVQEFSDPPGMMFVEVTPSGFGFGDGAANLVVVSIESNPDGATV